MRSEVKFIMLTYFIALGVLLAILYVLGRILPSILEFLAWLIVLPLYMLAGVIKIFDVFKKR